MPVVAGVSTASYPPYRWRDSDVPLPAESRTHRHAGTRDPDGEPPRRKVGVLIPAPEPAIRHMASVHILADNTSIYIGMFLADRKVFYDVRASPQPTTRYR